MRVLWFADVQLPAVTGESRGGGGWVEGLRSALERFAPDVELGIASPGPVAHEPFRRGNATYFHLAQPPARGRVAAVVTRWRHDPVVGDAVERLVEITDAYEPDVIHIHGAEHHFGLVIPFVQAPAVISLQGVATVLQRYVLSGLHPSEMLRELATQEFVRGNGPIHDYWRMRSRADLEQRILASCGDFMGRTEWDGRVLDLLRPGARYHLVGEILGDPFYEAHWSRQTATNGVLFCTAGGSATKGVECLLEAIILLRRAGLRRPVLRVAGNVLEGSLARKIGSLLEAPELRDTVTMLRRCAPVQIAEELTHASVFVLPSHMENSPNSLCEAMLVGTPCIAAYVGGVPTLVKDGVEGLLYNDSDPFALAGTIDRLLGDPDLAARLGAQAHATAVPRHDPECVVRCARDTYRDLLSRAPRPAEGAADRATKSNRS